jgi:hypothetical protein
VIHTHCECPGRTGQTLQTTHPELVVDWTRYLTPKAHSRIAAGSSPVRNNNTFECAAALTEATRRLVCNRLAWKWMFNSCHLDCWLVVQLSFFGALVGTCPDVLSDAAVAATPAMSRLIKVLAVAGQKNQDKLKMAYWAMEIEEYRGGTRKVRRTFRQPDVYQGHADWMKSSCKSTSGLDLVSVTIGLRQVCGNKKHTRTQKRTRSLTSVPVDDYWYSLPDSWGGRVIEGRWSFNNSSKMAHTSMSDVMHTLLGRSDGETMECKICTKDEPQSVYQATWNKDVREARMPVCLELEVDPGQTIPANDKLDVGGLEYTLLSVVFANGGHFNCNVMLDGRWYHYDGLGMVLEDGTTHLLRRIDSMKDNYMTPPQGEGQYTPISYRYMRMENTTLSPVKLPDQGSVPTDVQFNNMWRLLQDGY